MSETPRDQRALWREVSRTFEELGEALRVHLSPDAARSPSDPTEPAATAPTGPAAADPITGGDEAGAESAPWADPATGSPGRAGEGAGAADSDWIAPASDGMVAGGGADWAPSGPSAAGSAPSASASESASAPSASDSTRWAPSASAPSASESAPSASESAPSASESAPSAPSAPWGDPARPGEAEGSEDPWAAATAGDTPPRGSTAGRDEATAAGSAGGARERGWQEWSGTGGGRFATPADWESARESVRDLGSSARRLAAQAGDAARDPHVRDSAQRAARSLGDAIATTVEDFATDLRNRMRNPRWSDTSRRTERPPVAPIEDDHDEKI